MRQALTEEEKWRDLIGGFILAFGEIELFTYHLWADHFPNKKAPGYFKPRTKALIAALKNNLEMNCNTIVPLEDAFTLADKRNTIAHNPTMVEVYEHSQTGQIVTKRGIFSRSDSDFIDDAELTELLAAADDIVARLYRQHGIPRTGRTVR